MESTSSTFQLERRRRSSFVLRLKGGMDKVQGQFFVLSLLSIPLFLTGILSTVGDRNAEKYSWVENYIILDILGPLLVMITASIFGIKMKPGSSVLGVKKMFIFGVATFGISTVLSVIVLIHLHPYLGSTLATIGIIVLWLSKTIGCSAFLVAMLTSVPLEFPSSIATILGTLGLIYELGRGAGSLLGPVLNQVGANPFLVMGGLLTLCGLVTSFFTFPELPSTSEDRSETPSLENSARRKCLAGLGAETYLSLYTIFATICLYGYVVARVNTEYFADLDQIYSFMGCGILIAPLWGWIYDKKLSPSWQKYFLVFGVACGVLGFFVVAPMYYLVGRQPLWFLVTGGFLTEFGIWITTGPMFSQLILQDSSYGRFSGITVSIAALGYNLGSNAGPLLEVLSVFPLPYPFRHLAVLIFLLALLVLSFLGHLVMLCARRKSGYDQEHEDNDEL